MTDAINRKVGEVLMLSPEMAEHKFSLSEQLELSHYWVEDFVAVIEVRGELNKYCCSPHSSTAAIAASIRKATKEFDAGTVRAMIIRVDSPGGSWMGISDVIDAVMRAKKKMKVYTIASDMALSAGQWVFCLGHEAVASNSMTMLGGIGSYVVLTDTSELNRNLGIKKITVKSGENKAEGVDGEVTDRLIEEAQAIVTRLHEKLVSDIKENRKRWGGSHADGEVLFADQARRVGLVDDIMPFDDLLLKVQTEVEVSMAKEEKKVEVAVDAGSVSMDKTASKVATPAVQSKTESKPADDESKKMKSLEDENEKLKEENEKLKSKLEEKKDEKEDESKALSVVLSNAKAAGINIEGDDLETVTKQLAALAKNGSRPQLTVTDPAALKESAIKMKEEYIKKHGRFYGPCAMKREQPEAFKALSS